MRTLGTRTSAVICWLASIVVLALGAWLVCHAPNCTATEMDAVVMEWFARRRNETADHLFRAVTWLGSVVVLVPLVMAGMLILTFHQRVRESYFLVTSLLGTVAIMHVSKLIVARPRPIDVNALVAMPWDQSFPSAHIAQVASVMLASLLIAGRLNRRWLRWLLPFAVLAVIFVGVSRVYLQVHYPSDVVVGGTVAVLWVAGLAALMLRRASQQLEE